MAQSAWVSVSECARLYGRDRKWVYNRINKYNISTEMESDGNKRRFQLVDFIAHCGEPPNNGTPNGTDSHTQSAQVRTPEMTTENALLRQEVEFLTRQVQELERDRDERKAQLDTATTENAQLLDLATRLQKQNEILMIPPPKPKRRFFRWV